MIQLCDWMTLPLESGLSQADTGEPSPQENWYCNEWLRLDVAPLAVKARVVAIVPEVARIESGRMT
jgi:hypothetical protein